MTPRDVRVTTIYVGDYSSCVEILESRTVRRGELATIVKAENLMGGSHKVVVHCPPGTMRDAMDIIAEFVRLANSDPYRYSDRWTDEMDQLRNKAVAFLEGSELDERQGQGE